TERKVQIADLSSGRWVANEINDDGFACLPCSGDELCGNFGSRWFGDQYNDPGLGISREQVKRLMGGDRANLGFQIPAARSDRLRDPSSEVVDLGGDRLESGPGSTDQSDRAAANAVGKSQAHPVDNRRPAIWSHHQQALFTGCLLQRDLILERNVITVQEDMPVEAKCFARHSGRITSRHGDKHPVCLWQLFYRGTQAARAKI